MKLSLAPIYRYRWKQKHTNVVWEDLMTRVLISEDVYVKKCIFHINQIVYNGQAVAYDVRINSLMGPEFDFHKTFSPLIKFLNINDGEIYEDFFTSRIASVFYEKCRKRLYA